MTKVKKVPVTCRCGVCGGVMPVERLDAHVEGVHFGTRLRYWCVKGCGFATDSTYAIYEHCKNCSFS